VMQQSTLLCVAGGWFDSAQMHVVHGRSVAAQT